MSDLRLPDRPKGAAFVPTNKPTTASNPGCPVDTLTLTSRMVLFCHTCAHSIRCDCRPCAHRGPVSSLVRPLARCLSVCGGDERRDGYGCSAGMGLARFASSTMSGSPVGEGGHQFISGRPGARIVRFTRGSRGTRRAIEMTQSGRRSCMRIAQVAPPLESIPPTAYGGPNALSRH